jgi:BirA family biotin operon repressor/biotin-[acetyl-CoA-carboxylase] ligase
VEFRSWADDLSGWAKTRRRDIVLVSSVKSTNEVGLAAAAGGVDLDAWIFALHQVAGRGRFERPWSSPRGAGVYASWVFRAPRAALEVLPLVVGVGLCEGLGSLGFDCRLKWPNDVQLGGAKLGGILLQTRGSGDPASVVAGFGVNHGHRPEDLPGPEATSLALAAPERTPSLARLTVVLAEAVEDEVRRQRRSSWDAELAMERYAAWTAHRKGEALRFRAGDETCRGEFVGFSPQGHLRLLTTGGERCFTAGEIVPSLAWEAGSRG